MEPPLDALDAIEKEKGAEEAPQVPDYRGKHQINRSPGFLSKLLFFFVQPVVLLGRKVRLEEGDLLHRSDLQTNKVHQRFADAWEKEKKAPKPQILKTLLAGAWNRLLLTGSMYAAVIVLQFMGPLMLNRIVSGLDCRYKGEDGEECPSQRELYQYSLVLFVAPLFQALFESHQFYQLNVLGTRLRNALMAAIYRKCLSVTSKSLSETSVGKIVTLMSTDAQKVQDAALMVHALWGSPIIITVTLVFLYRYVKWATFVGLAVMFSIGPIAGRISRILAKLAKERVGWTDKRVGVVNEVITGIRVIKFYAWESSFMKRIQDYRNEEGKILRRTARVTGIFAVLLLVGPVFVAIACFSTYSLAGYKLSTADAYTALAFFGILRMPLSFLPLFISSAINACVGLKRIQGFLMMPDLENSAVDMENIVAGVVKIEGGDFEWDSSNNEPTLRDINLDIEPGSLAMVVGSVGSGKSSLLSAMIQQIEKVRGKVAIGGSVAYVAQSAWIINDTVRGNIIMGKPFDQQKYDAAIRTAQLLEDLAVWQKGDLTEIGERGITMSGGQKQRVSIARAVYADADVYLFDDPLSAVDAHVGKALFHDCLTGALAGKTIVLVSNAIQYLPHAKKVIWLDNGVIKASGSYDEVVLAGFDANFVTDSQAGRTSSALGSRQLSMNGSFATVLEGDAVEDEAQQVTNEEGTQSEVETRSSVGNGSPTIPAASPEAGQDWDENASGNAQSKEKSRIVSDSAKLTKEVFKQSGKTPSKTVTEGKPSQKSQELTGVEEREGGSIGKEVVAKYVLAMGGVATVITTAILMTIEQGFRIGTDRWVGLWAEEKVDAALWTYITVYASLGVCYGVFVYARSLHYAYSHARGALQLHRWLLVHMLRLPMQFYDTNPSGRIVNRFSRDMEIIDTTLLQTMAQFLGCFGVFAGIMVVICMATPLFTPFLIPIASIYLVIQRIYIPSGRELQRLEAITRSPIYTQFSETINGVPTIRAFGLIDHFVAQSDSRIELNGAAFATQKAASGWLSTRLDVIGLLSLILAAILAVQGSIEPALAGLSLVYALDLTKFLKFGTQMASKLESDLNSVERVVQYLKPGIEGDEDVENEKSPEADLPKGWPVNGAIKINNISMRYRQDTPLVLKNVSLDIKPGEKIGIAGRTGSGKSSLFLALYRMVDLEEGSLEIDGVDVGKMKLSSLRSVMSMIPQDPFMFSGTVRLNLDPFDDYHDDEVWKALEAVGLKGTIEKYPAKLSAPVVDNGGNFSQGQRQLFCLARAILRKSKILMMDEATASVDMETDALIQRAIHEGMKDTTVLTIAHRIHTIMDSDRVLVMDDGFVGEFDSPQELLNQDESLFARLVSDSHGSKRAILGASTFKMTPEVNRDTRKEDEEVDEAVSPLPKTASMIISVPNATLGADRR